MEKYIEDAKERADSEKGDLISRSALKKAIMNELGLGDEENGSDAEYMTGLQDCYNLIDNAPTVELFCSYLSDEEVKQPCVESPCSHERPHGEWFPVSERLPEETFNPNTQDFGEILCTTIWNDVRVYKFGQPIGRDRAHFWDYGQIVDEFVIAWQPLPKPYEEADNDN